MIINLCEIYYKNKEFSIDILRIQIYKKFNKSLFYFEYSKDRIVIDLFFKKLKEVEK